MVPTTANPTEAKKTEPDKNGARRTRPALGEHLVTVR
jgi:hypothetical protein